MSGPVTPSDTDQLGLDVSDSIELEVWKSRVADVGGQPVHRALPKRQHRTVGAWCFVDTFGPHPAGESDTRIGPHPHIGLHTVTWLLEGEILHTDSIGSEQTIRPGELNLMSAGHGVAHAEQTAAGYRGGTHGVQLWMAQPESTRHGEPAFEHHAELPRVALGSSEATVLVGSFAGADSPARTDTAIVGLHSTVRSGMEAQLDPSFEHAIVVIDGAVTVRGHEVAEHETAYLPVGVDELALWSDRAAEVLVLGGEPFESEILMWWNFVARTRRRSTHARSDWEAHGDRFPPVRSPLERIPAPRRP